MSLLNSYGFNVRRKRNMDNSNSVGNTNKKDNIRDCATTTKLAFAPAPPVYDTPSLKPFKHRNAIIKGPSDKSKLKKHATKEPKQTTLFTFLTSPSTHTASAKENNCTSDAQKGGEKGEEQDEERPVLCTVRKPITFDEFLPMLVESFGAYDDRIMVDDCPLLLKVKPSKAIYTLPLVNSDNDKAPISQQQWRRRRRSQQHSDEEEDSDDSTTTTLRGSRGVSLRSAFSQSLSLSPLKKKLKSPEHCGFLEHSFTELEESEEVSEMKVAKTCLSAAQINSLLMDIANEFLFYENNSWCASYLLQQDERQ